MNELLLITSADQLQPFVGLHGLPAIDPLSFSSLKPDAYLVLIQKQEQLSARCALWWTNTPHYGCHQVGLIGQYQVQDAASADLLLQQSCQELTAMGCTMAIAPMDGNTWRSYRLISDRGTAPPFFLEPNHPDDYLDSFLTAGFVPLATYSSALNADLTQRAPRLDRVERRLSDSGISIRSLNLDNFESELQQVYQLASLSFQNNFLYTPISQGEFITQYRQIQPWVKSELVLLAEQNQKLVGFLFAVPDVLQQKYSQIDTVIIKTVAVLPGRTYAGLGNVLVARVQAIAAQLGYTRAIHALMHDHNNSRNLSDRYATTMRRYTLFSKQLKRFLNPKIPA
ncbi:MAG: GNAT family N-acetyltransferase [Leptolyngbyaceae cyanobacterium CRU_2_3]|nr:GNAT family N-acetyltransferase [Leptolyngbyaceae cyanobacterium CRU_2_3]